jgi:hypothetical protein
MRALLLLALFPSLVLAQGVTVKAGSASNLVDVNANLQMRVTTSQDGGTLGETQIIGGSGNSVYVTEGNRLAVSQVWPLWDDTFNATAQNTAKYRAPIATMTVTFTGGYANINGGSIVTANTNAALQTYRTFALYAKSELQVNMSVMRTQAPQANCVEEMGLFTATLPGAAAPTDCMSVIAARLGRPATESAVEMVRLAAEGQSLDAPDPDLARQRTYAAAVRLFRYVPAAEDAR